MSAIHTEVSRGGYRGVMMSRGSSLPSPRGMMRGAASGMPLMGRGGPAKANPAWGGRNSRQMYGRPGFLRGYDVLCFSYQFIVIFPYRIICPRILVKEYQSIDTSKSKLKTLFYSSTL